MSMEKGYVKVGISKTTEKRLRAITQRLREEHPDKYEKNPSLHAAIIWLLDNQ